MKSQIFYADEYKKLEKKITEFLNSQTDFLSPRTIDSPRAVGDAIQDLLADNFGKILGDLSSNYSSDFARRAMADLAFNDKDGFYYVVDVKTHRLDSSFNMPNLTSVERLARFYEDDKNYFIVLKTDYKIQKTKIIIDKVNFVPIEFLGWDCLTLGALGWGQIQIANSNNVSIVAKNSRKKWMLELCDSLFEFYPREIGKINDRILYFKRVRKYWEGKKG
ncbi:MAG: Uncharacterized protein CEN89_204 [Candidatus Berkelbacteria bacterium Licking1014_7]|uniref:Type II restriction endonuclease n=1 Tax=Candidatus Berkelbacteria bacterium Licking1014_7 TaxID=2017147 RepID=A0A554LK24_9BACT|nr:MAG: Uncharacterized protein CEN89_204 [Candidatus Berkelbacteria bacterium Licking1014_7]